jgi:hypothetical protein
LQTGVTNGQIIPEFDSSIPHNFLFLEAKKAKAPAETEAFEYMVGQHLSVS